MCVTHLSNRRRYLRYDLRSTSHCLDSGEPLKRHCTNAPSMVDQKRARWQVVALVSRFSRSSSHDATTALPHIEPWPPLAMTGLPVQREPLKRHCTNAPSMVDQKRARWQVVPLVSRFSRSSSHDATTALPHTEP